MMKSLDRKGSILQTSVLLATICAACLLFSSCGRSSNIVESAQQSLELAQQGVEQFHSQFNSEQYAAIYAASDYKFRQATTEPDFSKLLETAHRKLGNVRQSNLQNSGVTWPAGQGATVTMLYDTRFVGGSGTEQFVWHIADNSVALYTYRINSSSDLNR